MATIKLYSDFQQSKKLKELLPSESADMEYLTIKENGALIANVPFVKDDFEVEESAYDQVYDRIPCWSLAVLLNIIAKQDFIIKSSKRNNEYQYSIDIPSRHCKIWFSSLLDAAFEMVCWLKENNKL